MISLVLANMFLHYVFDMWMKRNFPQAPFERYADDGVIHCGTKEEALYIKEKLAECGMQAGITSREDKDCVLQR